MSGLPANVLRLAARFLPVCCCVLVFPIALRAQEQTSSAPHAGHAMASPAPSPGQAGQTKPGELPDAIKKPIPLMPKALGPFTRKISTSNAEAQAFFTQGMQMMYSFAKLDAVRSFRAAWTARSDLRHLLLGRGVGVGLVSERPMTPSTRRSPTPPRGRRST